MSVAERSDIFGASGESDPSSPWPVRSRDNLQGDRDDDECSAVKHHSQAYRAYHGVGILLTPYKKREIAASYVPLLIKMRCCLRNEC